MDDKLVEELSLKELLDMIVIEGFEEATYKKLLETYIVERRDKCRVVERSDDTVNCEFMEYREGFETVECGLQKIDCCGKKDCKISKVIVIES